MFRFEPRPVTIRGVEHTFYVFPHPGAVAVIPEQDGRLGLIRQYRPAIEKSIFEFPAGVLEKGEDPESAALRELAEETGFRAATIKRLGGLYASPGYSAEYLHVFLATELAVGETNFDPGEQIDDPIWLTPEELAQMILQGEVEDAKTIAALFLYQQAQRHAALKR